MRIENLPYSNIQTQGAKRREWLRQHAPQHLQHCMALAMHGVQARQSSTSHSTVILGAGACTEVPLNELTRSSDEVVLVDIDGVSMQQAGAELASLALRKRVHLLATDISGGVSTNLARLIERQDWHSLKEQGAVAVFDVAAQCLEQCIVPDPPVLETLFSGAFGLVISSLVLSQLFSYPLLDLLDTIQRSAPVLVGEQERHRRYQDAAQAFRMRVITAHLHLLRELVDRGGASVLISDVRGFAFNVYGTDHDARHRREIPLVPRAFFDAVRANFMVVEEKQWEWITDLPEQERPGRGYEVVGYVLQSV